MISFESGDYSVAWCFQTTISIICPSLRISSSNSPVHPGFCRTTYSPLCSSFCKHCLSFLSSIFSTLLTLTGSCSLQSRSPTLGGIKLSSPDISTVYILLLDIRMFIFSIKFLSFSLLCPSLSSCNIAARFSICFYKKGF